MLCASAVEANVTLTYNNILPKNGSLSEHIFQACDLISASFHPALRPRCVYCSWILHRSPPGGACVGVRLQCWTVSYPARLWQTNHLVHVGSAVRFPARCSRSSSEHFISFLTGSVQVPCGCQELLTKPWLKIFRFTIGFNLIYYRAASLHKRVKTTALTNKK